MGKLLICSNGKDFVNLKKSIIGFEENYNFAGDCINLAVYDKLRIHSENYLEIGKDLVIGVGTVVYKNSIGNDALKKIYNDFDGDINRIQDNAIGSYCIAIKKNGILSIFVDASSVYNIYYYLKDDRFILTNTYYHIAKNTGVESTPEQFFSVWIKKAIRCDKSVFPQIKKLCGNQCISFDGERWKLKYIGFASHKRNGNIAEMAISMYKGIPLLFSNSGIFMTGGQDSRLSLALMLSIGMKPELFYGEGNSNDTATRDDDKQIVKEIADRYSLPLNIMNWRDSDKSGINKYIDKYGEMFNLYYLNKNIINEFENNINVDLLCFGYFGEVYRTIESIDAYNNHKFSLDQYIDDIYIANLKALFDEDFYLGLRSKIRNALLDFCAESGIDSLNITKDDFQKLNTVYRQNWDTQLDNFANQFFFSFALFGNKILTDFAEGVSYDARYNSKFQMQCINDLYPDLLQVPFFSHMKVKTYDPQNNTLTDSQVISRVKDRIRPYIKARITMRVARFVYYTLRGDNKAKGETEKELLRKDYLLSIMKNLRYANHINLDKSYNIINNRMVKDYINLDYMISYINDTDE